MKKSAICVLAVLLAAACDSNITDLGRPVLVTSSTGASSSSAISVVVSPATTSMPVGTVAQLSARAVDNNGVAVSGTPVWSSSNSAVATVDGTGVVTARAAGTAVITATVNGAAGSAVVSVS